mmetsp:Transcript_9477/g.13640  ORF Transcript_9477/g.13640 Transcript_9477/m.13640 type:complete len:197 (-) Transcript_9477:161-751(-)|eukprot:CAMPEP_0202461156 /NCGR_PEP_ID=MMETSP1360-20130828/48078_1 /ASSEMBLY_ACC=CAM_ASM_000848 /TAXON_ID=515479 /ORGANISM="Licmophora paradoxa, Strain CCMP2313" /LENGTH=196 /DNA_ID=CAMNT_0049083083 /DNA_START=136 /DNA_END=726 /DNA_ORIENTATION=-
MPSNNNKMIESWESSHSTTADIGRKISDAMNDDFLVMDGLNEDFDSLIQVDPYSAFDEALNMSSLEDSFNLSSSTTDNFFSHERPACSRSPSPKRRRPSPIQDHTDNLEELQAQYKLAMQQLALSMRRSEMSRHEIYKQREEQEAKARLQAAAHAKQYSNADSFLSGSRTTLTVGLEQSRQMLRSYMGQMKKHQIF